MRRELEDHMRSRIRGGETPRDVIESMLVNGHIQSPKQAWRTLEKWSRTGEYDYGVSLDLGWLTPTAP